MLIHICCLEIDFYSRKHLMKSKKFIPYKYLVIFKFFENSVDFSHPKIFFNFSTNIHSEIDGRVFALIKWHRMGSGGYDQAHHQHRTVDGPVKPCMVLR